MRKTISFDASATVDLYWQDFKAIVASKGLRHQFVEEENTVSPFAIDGPVVYSTLLFKSPASATATYASEYDQAQNDADLADFEANFRASANLSLDPRTSDGRTTVRNSSANRMTNFKLRVISFYTATKNHLHNVSPVTDADRGDVLIKLYDVAGLETNVEAEAVRTVLDFEPHYDYEVIGGFIDLPSSLKDGVTDAWFISAVGVPDYPPAYYGQVDFVSEVNLEAVTSQRVVSDGRAISFMPYQLGGMPGTNKLRFVVKHPVGESKRFQIYIEHFTQ